MNYENYVKSIGDALREVVTEARRAYDAGKGSPEESYQTGYLMGLHRVVTLMQQQADAYEIPDGAIGVGDLDETYFA